MKKFIRVLCLLIVLVSALPAVARLRSPPRMDPLGLYDEDPSHVAVIFDGVTAFVSNDAGANWEKRDKAKLPQTLAPLPETGEVRYLRADLTLLCSRDGGKTWKDISPIYFFNRELRNEIQKARNEFNSRFSRWLPSNQYWPVSFLFSILSITTLGTVVLIKRGEGEPWGTVLALTLASYLLIGLALWLSSMSYMRMISHEQWQTLSVGFWSEGMIYPRWPLGVIFHLCGNPLFAPLTAIICFPFTPMFGTGMIRRDTRFTRILRLAWILLGLFFLLAIPFAMVFGRGTDYLDFP